MSNNIERTDLYKRLASIKKTEQWLKACHSLGLRVCRGTKHPSTIRNPELPEDHGKASLITVIPNNLYKRMNQQIFKQILKHGVTEDNLWRALDMLK